MNEHLELDPRERAALASWAACEVPTDFAERVMRAAIVEPTPERDEQRARAEGRRRELATWRIGAVAAAAAIVLGLFFVSPRRAMDASDGDLTAARALARDALLHHCTPCHSSGHADAEPDAVAVFDVDREDWDASMSSEALELSAVRLASRTGGVELAGFRSYIDGELVRRGR